MGLTSGVFDCDPIQPLVKAKENLAILFRNAYKYFRVEYIEGVPPGSQSTVDMVAIAAAGNLAANGTITKRVVPALQLNEGEMLHLRWEPLDNVEGILWEPAGTSKMQTRIIQSRVNMLTKNWDPWLATTTFWILGNQLDMNLEVRNPMAVAIPMARFIFWGWRYLLTEIIPKGLPPEIMDQLLKGDPEAVRKAIGVCTWISAEAKSS